MERAEKYRVYDYIRIYDKEFNLIREISEYNSLIFTENAEGIGEFELHLREKDVDIESFGHYMKVGNDLSMVGIIEYEYWNGDGFDQESAEDYTIKGYTLMGLLANRIILPETWSTTGYRHYNAPIEDIIYDLIDSQVIHSGWKERNIPYLHIPTSRHRGKTITADYRNNSLVETLQELISQTNLYFQFEMRPKEKGLWLWILEGDDHRTGEDKYIISKRYDRVQEETYEHSALGTKNYAYVYGEGDGADRELVKVYRNSENEYKEDILNNPDTDIPSSIDRREVYIDARDVQSDDVDNNEVTGEEVDEDELKRKTRQVLFDRGVEKLNELRETASLEFIASPDEYGTYYNLGDMLLYRNEETGTTQEGKVVEVTHTFEGASHEVVVTCGHSKTTILSAIQSAANDATVERTGISAKFKEISADFANFEMTVTDQLLAQNASIGEIQADIANLDIVKVTEMLEATQAEIDKLRAEWAEFDTVEITNMLTAHQADIEQLQADIAKFDIVDITDKLTAAQADIDQLKAEIGDFDIVNITEQLNALNAKFDTFEATYGNVDELFANYFSAHKITGDMIDAGTIKAEHLVTKTITREWLADGTITADQIMDSAITGDKLVEGTITGVQIADGAISAEKLQANSITGDQIMANSIDASKLVAGSITAELLALDALMSRNYRANGDNSEVYEGTFINMTDGSIHTPTLQINGLTGDAIFSGNINIKEDQASINFYNSLNMKTGALSVDSEYVQLTPEDKGTLASWINLSSERALSLTSPDIYLNHNVIYMTPDPSLNLNSKYKFTNDVYDENFGGFNLIGGAYNEDEGSIPPIALGLRYSKFYLEYDPYASDSDTGRTDGYYKWIFEGEEIEIKNSWLEIKSTSIYAGTEETVFNLEGNFYHSHVDEFLFTSNNGEGTGEFNVRNFQTVSLSGDSVSLSGSEVVNIDAANSINIGTFPDYNPAITIGKTNGGNLSLYGYRTYLDAGYQLLIGNDNTSYITMGSALTTDTTSINGGTTYVSAATDLNLGTTGNPTIYIGNTGVGNTYIRGASLDLNVASNSSIDIGNNNNSAVTIGTTSGGNLCLYGYNVDLNSYTSGNINIGTSGNPNISIGNTSNTNSMKLYARYIYLGYNTNTTVYSRGTYVNIDSGNIGNYQSSSPSTDTILKSVYPVGSVYMSTSSLNPRNVLGFGTWTQVSVGYYPISAGTGKTAAQYAGTLNHNHTQTLAFTDIYVTGNGLAYTNGGTVPNSTHFTGTTGFNPQYIAFYMFYRTA